MFRTDLPARPFRLQRVGPYVMANKGYYGMYGKWARWIDADGAVVFAIDEYAFGALPLGEDMLAVTPRSICRLKRTSGAGVALSPVKWSVEMDEAWSREAAAGGALTIGDNDALVYAYHPIADSGVRLKRLSADQGEIRWSHYCMPLGVEHSLYQHRVRVKLVPRGVEVTSVGERTFVETVELETGKRASRVYREER